MKGLWRVLLVAAPLVLAACGSGKPSGTLQIAVDSNLAPAQPSLPGPDGTPRPLARMVGESGIPMDFVLGELVVTTDDETKLNNFLNRWGGRVLSQTTVSGATKTYQVRLDPSAAQVEAILQRLNQNLPDLKGRFSTSSPAAAQLLAVALAEANQEKMTVTPNFVFASEDIATGSTSEAPTSATPGVPYSPDAFQWTYMNQGSPQDIGVGKAWQVLQRAGRFSNRVPIMIIDGGFAPNSDFPVDRVVVGSWNVPNLLTCSSSPCPWHGTHVTTATMGLPDNGFGVAGPAGPVGQLIAVPFQGDFFGMISTLDRILTAVTFGNPKIINMSFGFELDLGWDAAVKASCLGLCPSPSQVVSSFTALVAASGKLLFAAAGNQGKDVDNGGAIIEGSTHIPCEANSVICVGGMAHNATARDPQSNFGSKRDEDSVDIYGPFAVWTGADPDNPSNQARLRFGTSYASPFVAGVAALVWAANPSLSASQVWAILRDTAHVGGVGVSGHERRVNALGAVSRALAVGDSGPSVTLSGSANADLNREWAVTANVTDFAGTYCPPVYCPLSWDPAPTRVVGQTAYYRFNTAGSKTVRVTARDLLGREGSATRTVNVTNTPPVVSISQPTDGATFFVGQNVQLLGSATDLNEGPDPGPGPIPCRWDSSNAGDGFPRTGCNITVNFSTPGPRTLTLSATDPQGLSQSVSVTITVNPPPANLPPNITLGNLSPSSPNYTDGYRWDTRLTAPASATDPEGNTPITYIWKATSFRPNSTVVWRSDVTLSTSTATGNLDWTPQQNNPNKLLGDFGDFGNACYNGQTVRLTLIARDSLGNESRQSLPDIKVYVCTLD